MITGNPKSLTAEVAKRIREAILSGKFKANDKIPSVREMAGSLEVNPGTVAKVFQLLQMQGILYVVRNISYNVSEEAYDIIIKMEKERFFEKTLPKVFSQMELLNIDMNTIETAMKEWKEEQKNIPDEDKTLQPISNKTQKSLYDI